MTQSLKLVQLIDNNIYNCKPNLIEVSYIMTCSRILIYGGVIIVSTLKIRTIAYRLKNLIFLETALQDVFLSFKYSKIL